MTKIKFSIPGFYKQSNLIQLVLDDYKNNRSIFNDDIIIDTIYDSFPCIWNGGRTVLGYFDDDMIDTVISKCNELNIGLRYTFTNSLLCDSDFKNKVANRILEVTNDTQQIRTGINVANLELKKYIEDKYKDKFYFLLSTTLAKDDINEINNLSKDNIVVPSYTINNDFDKISKLENKDNIEFLVAEACVDNCLSRQDHYRDVSCTQIYGYSDMHFKCPHNAENLNFNEITKRNHYISIDDIRSKYVPLGFTNFKISGRADLPIHLIEKFIQYLIKPEFQNDTREKWSSILYRYAEMQAS